MHSQKRAGSVENLINKTILGCGRMARDSLVDDTFCRLPKNLLQVDCQNLLSTGLLQVVLTCLPSLQKKSCNKPDFHRLVEN